MITIELKNKAQEYFAAGLSVLPVKADKRPAVRSWDKDKGTTPQEFTEAVEGPNGADIAGLAVICGPVSGGLECIDIDTKADTTEQIWTEYEQALRSEVPDLYARLVIASTPTGGRHIYYRWDHSTAKPGTERQGGLAFIPGPSSGQRGAALIETRIYGGYAAVPPGAGREFIQGSLLNVPQITPEERAKLWNIARSLTRYTEPERRETIPTATGQHSGTRPSDYFNAVYTIEDILLEAGWQVGAERAGRTYVRRPGATTEQSGNIRDNVLLIHSTSSGLPVGKGMEGAFSVYAWLNFGGDFSAAARSPKAAGCRTPTPPRRVPTPHSAIIATTSQGQRQQVSRETFVVTDIPGAGVRKVLIQYTPEATQGEIRAILEELDNARRPGVFLQQVNEHGEPGVEVHAATWWLDYIMAPYMDRPITDSDRLEIIAQLVERAGLLHEPVVRDLFVEDAKRLDMWAALGVSKATIAQELTAAQQRAQERARLEDIQRKNMELAEYIQQADSTGIDRALNEMARATLSGSHTRSISLIDPAAVWNEIREGQDGLKTGFAALDDGMVRLMPGSLNIVGARTGNGKTAFLMNMAVQVAAEYKDKVFYHVPYEEPKAALLMRYLRIISGQNWSTKDIKAAMNGEGALANDLDFFTAVNHADALLDKHTGGIVVMDPAKAPTIEQVAAFLAEEKERGINVGGVFIDHAGIVRVGGKFSAGEARDRMTHVSGTCRTMAIDLEIPVVLAAQLNRDAARNSGEKRPQLHHLKESGSLEEDAALVMLLLATEYDDPNVKEKPECSDLMVYVDKARDCPKQEQKLHFFGATRQVVHNTIRKPRDFTKHLGDFVKRKA
jgi:replicative DNA helicase